MLRDRAVWVLLSLAFLFSVSAVTLGLDEIEQQNGELSELNRHDQIEREVSLTNHSDWGSAAYYTFHLRILHLNLRLQLSDSVMLFPGNIVFECWRWKVKSMRQTPAIPNLL